MPQEMPRLKTTSKDKNELMMRGESMHHASAANLVAPSIMKMVVANKKYNFLCMLSDCRPLLL